MRLRTGHTSIALAAGSILAITITAAFAVLLVRAAPDASSGGVTPATSGKAAAKASPLTRGVRAVLTAGDVRVERRLAAPSFHLVPGQSLDARLPAGPFTGTFTLGFRSGPVRYARLGAWLQGGSLIVRRKGRMIADDYAGEEPRLVISTEPVFLGDRLQDVEYELTANGDGPVSFRAVWQPEGAQVPLPLPGDGLRFLADPADRGLAIAQELQCVACHGSANPALQTLASAAPAPDIVGVGARARPEWLMFWMSIPDRLRPGTSMPRLFRTSEIDTVLDIAHFLVDRAGGPLPPAETPLDPGPVAAGRVLYHQVGCAACHGALDGSAPSVDPYAIAVLPDLASKTTVETLAAFLLDPLVTRPSGLMPAMALDEAEATAIASYLISLHPAPAPSPFAVEPARVARGRVAYAARGCASCHERTPNDAPGEAIVSTLVAPPLESLRPDASGGCLGAEPGPGVPRFSLTRARRADLAAFLERVSQRVCDDVPHERTAATMQRMRCLSCHQYWGTGGPTPELAAHFSTIGEADLGDEGRLPPDLSSVGARLERGWTRQVLEDAARARPYLATRMPQYGAENVDHLPADLASIAGVGNNPDRTPPFDVEAAATGRALVGDKALNCIQCHDVAGRPASGTPGPDLAKMAERLRYEGYTRWLHDPSLTRPGTRMPSFFVGGRGAFTDYYDGDAAEQIRAIWCYLSQGEMLALPDGLVDPQGLALDVTGDEPVVFRTFMADAGVRAIACGYPEQVHCAFDADRCRIAAAWQGPFLNASGAWAARGGSETNPVDITWTAPDEPVFGDVDQPWTSRFRGYRLDEQRRPIFQYELTRDNVTLRVDEQPLPRRDGMNVWFVRRVDLRGPPGLTFTVDGRTVTLGRDGRAEVELEMRWEEESDEATERRSDEGGGGAS